MRDKSSADSGDQRTCILRAEHLLHSRSYFLVGKELASIQLFDALLDLLPKPGVMVQVLLHKLLNIVIRTAAMLGRGTLNLRLNLGCEMDFHRL